MKGVDVENVMDCIYTCLHVLVYNIISYVIITELLMNGWDMHKNSIRVLVIYFASIYTLYKGNL